MITNTLTFLVGFIGVVIAAILLAIENNDASFQTKITFKLIGILIFVSAVIFVQRRWFLNKKAKKE
ncbi:MULTISPECIES: hypothetical protein [unclassified Sporosarcina]|uniref:hypothetical protein n=1 Tax=unclassified Sporosarcina TaxID=2647733 RepID=UPI00203F261B|nr:MULTISPECIES: hypothetical protein [unclassified Sporosarcina]GKV67462.1 hypothetical protein NCCP2331_36150 [Sporosarcina sp. NCCP-2331]GLB57826.1 hypothetical protein NCCP2378_36200 [Sporosarcina sp. NCCP-2378]